MGGKMRNLKWIFLGYILAISIHGCDSVLGNGDGSSSTSDLEFGDYGTVAWNPLYVKIVD